MTAFEKAGLRIIFSFQRSPNPLNPSLIAITLTATNSNSSPMTDFVFQCAVPKVCTTLCAIHLFPLMGNRMFATYI